MILKPRAECRGADAHQLCPDAVLEIDALGTFNMSRAAFAALKSSGDAAIINISATLHYGATWYQVPCRAVPCRAVPCRAVPCRAIP